MRFFHQTLAEFFQVGTKSSTSKKYYYMSIEMFKVLYRDTGKLSQIVENFLMSTLVFWAIKTYMFAEHKQAVKNHLYISLF